MTETATPSIFGSTVRATWSWPRLRWNLLNHCVRFCERVAFGSVCCSVFSSSSLSSCMSSMESMGTRCCFCSKPSSGVPPTRWVGESGVMRSGWRASSFLSLSSSWSNSWSDISGFASW